MWHITKREIYDNLNSLRFALATVLLLGLMLTNAVVHLRGHPEQVQKYREGVAEHQNKLKTRADESLYTLARKGPGDLYKNPSPLRFCAESGEAFLSERAESNYHRWGWGSDDLESFWILEYPSVRSNLKSVRPDVTKVDWGFIIGYVLSLIALLFTFDSITGEREQGTLRLMLANSIPRHTVLIGKFLGALISISLPFMLAILMNLLVISTSSDVYLDGESWGRLGIIIFIALLYTCLFLALGLLVSARAQRGAVSLVILLLMWVSFVVFMPSTLASIAGASSPIKSTGGFSERSWQLHWELDEKYSAPLFEAREDSTKRIQLLGEFVTTDVEQQERLHAERLRQRIAQVHRARAVTRISPVTIVQHLLESFAGTGFERHLQFLENVQSYARQFRAFIVDTDREDPDSLHFLGVPAGMSGKPVSPEAVPKFEDTLSFSKDLNAAAVDLLLLMLFVIVLLSGAYLAFVRVEV
ncbi:ABC transporter permease subunit [Candidatus Poribacteria bacterium]|nr:ABC transporter permease subunit [Candidatus Poribacteria bacterium]MYH84150.1 ABC transporter permease subunit [Candidatus Poribacteria bacterium]MYK96058.1 ABC transporter permease subunit [Candidatus Poribacteria bacterium]